MTDLPRVNNITEEDFNQWATHPVTQAYRKFLKDFGQAAGRAHTERWLNGAEENEQMERGQALACLFLGGLTFEDMLNHYQNDDEDENDDEGQADQ